MPHASLKLVPGVDQNRTPALNEAAISESNLIRFVPDRNGLALPQKLGGWTRYYSQPMTAIVRALWAWADTNDDKYLAIGSEDGVYTIKNDFTLDNRSPQTYVSNPTMSFNTTSGSNEVEIDDTGSNVSNYDSIFLSTHVSIGGLVLFGFYNCEAATSNRYSIFSRNVIGLPVNATSTVATGGTVATLTTVSGSQSVTVTLANNNFSVGSTFPILIATTVGGITLYGNYIVRSITSPTEFVIAADNSATSSATVSINSGKPQITYYVGQKSFPPSVGYGGGGYGAGGYGSGVTSSGGRTFVTTAASCVGTVATVSFTGAITVPAGSQVTIAGVTPTGYNGTWTVTSSTTGATSTISFTVPSTLTAQTVAGTVVVTVWDFGNTTDWTLDNWGEYLIASPNNAEIYYWNPNDGGAYASVLPNAPKVNEGCFVAMPERQIIAYGSTFNGIKDPLLVRWCDIGNFTSWVGTVSNQAGSFRIPKGSRIVGGLQGPQQGLLWTDLGVWSMQYINLPLVWSFNEIGNGCGLIGRRAASSLNGTVYWMGQSQFFTLSSGGVQPLPCPVWDVVFQDIDMNYASNIRCAPNSRFGEIAWYYPTIGSGGVPTNYVKYNVIIGQWDYGTLTRTAWIDQSVLGAPIGSGGDNVIYQHETSKDADGQAMTSYFQTGYFTLQDGDVKTFVDQLWPDMKWGYFDGPATATVSITFYVTDYPGQTPSVFGPYSVTQATTYITPRFRGRLVSIRVESSDVGSFWRLGNIRYRLQPDGKF
jgi:hypothetical protein